MSHTFTDLNKGLLEMKMKMKKKKGGGQVKMIQVEGIQGDWEGTSCDHIKTPYSTSGNLTTF